MQGVLNVLKPPGMTSHDVVAWTRRTLGIKRVGHTGTLDPAAAGVLAVCVGSATRLVEYLQEGSKEYIAEATFGFETDTLDAVGSPVRRTDAAGLNAEQIYNALSAFRGAIRQTPPLYSAIKQDGKKLYELARAGVVPAEDQIPARDVIISHLEMTRFLRATSQTPPCAMLRIECSGGTYIRSLVRDIGLALNSAATMTFLVRTRNGHFLIDEAHPLEEIATDPAATLLPMASILPLCAHDTIIDDAAIGDLAHGRVIPAPHVLIALQSRISQPRVLFRDAKSTQAALASLVCTSTGNWCRAEKVFDLRD